MYNYYEGSPGDLPESFVARLTELEQSLGVPIRIMNGYGRQVRDNNWPAEHCGDFSNAEARENGITVAFGSRGDYTYPYLYLSDSVTAGEYAAVIEVPTPSNPWEDVLEYDFGFNHIGTENRYTVTTQFGEIQQEPRIVLSWASLPSYWRNYNRDARWSEPLEVLFNLLIEAIEQHFGANGLTDEERAALRAERAQAAFNRYVERVFNGQLQARRQSIDQRTAVISNAQATIARETAQLAQDQQLLDALLLVQQNDSANTLRQEFELLASHPRLVSRDVRGKTLVLKTTDDLRLTREDTGESRWLGQFEITIDLESFAIKIKNLNTMRGGRHHPHIPGDGSPCFGSHANGFYELLGQGQLYVCFDLLLQYLESVNLRDEWGRYASYWFEVPDERPLDENGLSVDPDAIEEAAELREEEDEENLELDEENLELDEENLELVGA